MDHVQTVVLLPDEQQPLDVLGLAARFDDVSRRMRLDVLDRGIEVSELLERDDRDPVFLQLLLAKSAVVLEPVRVGCAADNVLACRAQGGGFFALPENVVEDNDIGPVDFRLPVIDFWNEAVADIALGFAVDVIANLVAFAVNLPGDIADECVQRDEEKATRRSHGGIPGP